MKQKLGNAKVDITPDFEVELSGFAARVQPCVGVRDPIYIRALYVEEREERLLWIHADLMAFPNGLAAEMKGRLGERFGLEARQIVLSATHTHSAPTVQPLLCAGENPEKYVDWLRLRIEAAAEQAVDETEPVEPFLGEGSCGLTRDRRGKASAFTDTRMAVVGWKRPGGDWAAVLGNYPIHPVAFSWDNRRISADLFGVAATALEGNLPGRPLVFLTNGAAANQNPPFLTDDETQVRAWGVEIAAAFGAALDAAQPLHGTALRSMERTVPIPLETFEESCVTVDRYLENVRERSGELSSIAEVEDAKFLFDRLATAGRRWREKMVRQREAGVLPETLPVIVQMIGFGDVIFACFAAEIFSLMTDELREATGKRIFVVGYANGYNGYICPDPVYDEGGYEPGSAFIFGAILRPRRGAHETLRERAKELIEEFSAAIDEPSPQT